MQLQQAEITAHDDFGGGYRLLSVQAPAIASQVRPGQFVHLLIPGLEGAVLRRPFSVFRAADGTLSILYKPVGRGTRAMVNLPVGATVSLMGPLGNGFPTDVPAGVVPVLVTGGYGVAPLCLVAAALPRPGLIFIGGGTARDVLCADEFARLGWRVEISTEDGSLGWRGRVTAPLDAWLERERGRATPEFFSCGPDGLLEAVGERAIRGGWRAWLSLDKHMGCGAGACLACVQRIRRDEVESWARVCKDGPVFEAREIVWNQKPPAGLPDACVAQNSF